MLCKFMFAMIVMSLFAAGVTAADPLPITTVEKKDYGKTADGTTIEEFTLTNKNAVKAKVITYGAILTELYVPDKDGKLTDVVLGFDDLKGYLGDHPYFGATVGRVAN